MKGSYIKSKWPRWAKNNKIQDDDVLYLVGDDKMKILKGKKDEIKMSVK